MSEHEVAELDDPAVAPARPRPRARRLLWGAAGLVVVGGGILFWLRREPSQKDSPKIATRGVVVCPAEEGMSAAPSAGLRAGDYMILVVADRRATFQEVVWAQVLSRAPDGDTFFVRLLGRMGKTGAVALSKEKHGFRIGSELKVDAECVWDTMRAPDVEGKGQLYCGFAGEDLLGDPPVFIEDLREGDEVKIAVSTVIGRDAHAEWLWARVDGISRTGNVIYGTIVSEVQFPIHGFRRWQEIEFGRDCIFGGRRP